MKAHQTKRVARGGQHNSNFKLPLKTLMLLTFLFFIQAGCQKPQEIGDFPEQQGISSSIIEKLKAAGFRTGEGISKYKDGYIVEYDIFLTEKQIDELISKANTPKKGAIPGVKQYTTNNLVTVSGSTRNILVYMDPSFSTFMQNAFDAALARFNTADFSLTFTRTTNSSLAEISVVPVWHPSFLGSAGFPSGGNPYGQIEINTNFFGTSSTRADATTVIAHEIGHTIGLRHSDFMDRSFSCGGSYDNEGQASEGANHVPGTSVGGSTASFMLACSNGTDRPFTNEDLAALKGTYTYRKNIYVKVISTFLADRSYAVGCCDDQELVDYNMTIELYQDAGHTIPFTTADVIVLNVSMGPENSSPGYQILTTGSNHVYDLGTSTRDRYYSYGNLVSDNSTGINGVYSFGGYYGPTNVYVNW